MCSLIVIHEGDLSCDFESGLPWLLSACMPECIQRAPAVQEEMFMSEETATDRMDTIMKYTQVLTPT